VKYFVAYLLSGDAKRYHETLTRELADTFHIIPLHDRIPPHITIKPPFEADNAGIEEVERILRSFVRGQEVVPISFSGFGRFGFRTIYLDTEKNRKATSFVRRCIGTLNANIPWMPAYPLEGNKLHASVARFLTRKQFRRIWRAVKELRPQFESSFDAVAILKKHDRSWQMHTLIPLKSLEDSFLAEHSIVEPTYTPFLIH
jgi:2'-5' RNA ligase